MQGEQAAKADNDTAAIVTFFRGHCGHELSNKELTQLSRQLRTAYVDLGVLRGVLSGGESAAAIYLQQTHRLASEQGDDWLLQILQKAPLFEHLSSDSVQAAFLSLGLDPERSLHLYAGFLGKAEFEWARHLSTRNRTVSDQLLMASSRHTSYALKEARGLDLVRASRYQAGMMGVSHLLLAKGCAEPEGEIEHLKAAIHFLEMSESNGDRSREHYRYLGEAYLDLADHFPERVYVEAAFTALKKARSDEGWNPEVESLFAQAAYRLGVALVREGDMKGADERLALSIVTYRDVLRDPPDDLIGPGIVGRLGSALLYRWWTSGDIGGVRDAVVYLKSASDEDPGFKHSLAHALLILARNDRANVDERLGEALTTIESIPPEEAIEERTKLRGRIRLANAVHFENETLFAAALEDFELLNESDDPEVAAYLGDTYGLRGLLTRSISDLEHAEALLRDTPERGERESPGLYPRICRELALIVAEENPNRSLQLLDSSITRLKEIRVEKRDPAIPSMIAGAHFHRFHIGGSIDDLHEARVHYELAIAAGGTAIELFGLAGDCNLQCAKSEDDPQQREELLMTAVEYLLQSGKFGEKKYVNASKLGEAYYRLGRHLKDPEMMRAAVSCFNESQQLGNDSPENHGLLGDAYYQLSRYERKLDHLWAALRHKEVARGLAAPSREHLSLVSKIHGLLYEELGLQDDLDKSVKFAVEAVGSDPDWPWPTCQLAEILERHPEAEASPVIEEVQSLLGFDKGATSLALALWDRGAGLVLRSPEIRARVVGGKSGAWVAEDPLGLLEHAFVFKPSTAKTARRAQKALSIEVQQLEIVAEMLQRSELEGVEVARVVGILDQAGRPILVMRRAVGLTLSNYLRGGVREAGLRAITKAVRFLASYHAAIEPVRTTTNWTRLSNHLAEIGGDLVSDTGVFVKALLPCRQDLEWLPPVAKRDAHCDNWLVRPDGSLVVLDIEAPQPRFLFEELTQLLEDVPFLPLTDQGVEDRLRLTHEYLHTLGEHSPNLNDAFVHRDDECITQAYVFFATCLALHGLRLARRRAKVAVSSSAVHRWTDRRDHYLSVLDFVEDWSSRLSGRVPDWRSISRGLAEVRADENQGPEGPAMVAKPRRTRANDQ